MHKLMRYIKGYEKQALLAPLFKMLEACFELFVPLVIASIIDTGINLCIENHLIRKNKNNQFIIPRFSQFVLQNPPDFDDYLLARRLYFQWVLFRGGFADVLGLQI